MGQTLTHGVYLPDEGERNCYNGLASNWSILDNSVGTVAEHTSALSGKAPLVHTHTKSDITDFPALATVATSGSYNDLSNIPASFTPASHSHGNVTNDGKVGTTANKPLITGTDGVVQAGSFGTAANTFCEGNDSRLSDARTPVAHTHGKADITDLFNSANTWAGDNTFRGSNSFDSGLTINNAALLNAVLQNAVKGSVSTTGDFAIFIKDKVNGNAATSLLAVYRGGQDSGGSYAQINIDTKGNDNNRYNNSISLRINPADNSNNAILIPQRDKTIDLGTSSNQWKSLNGINPGALSFPVTALDNTYDISGNITDLTGGNNSITAARTGWIFVKSDNATEISIENTITGMGASDHSATAATLMVSIPVTSGETLNIIANCTSIDKAYLLPCQGNV